MTSTKSKRGRKHIPHRTAWGENIDGLYKCPDGRWRIVSTGEKFTEHDERLAVLRFRRRQTTKIVDFDLPVDSPAREPRYVPTVDRTPRPDERVIPYADDFVTSRVPEADLWVWFRNQLFTRPQYVAQQVGIEQLGYLSDLRPPSPSPTLAEVGKLYHDRAAISGHWRKKSQGIWGEFCAVVKVKTLLEVTQELLAAFKSHVLKKAKSPTYTKHRFTQVKTILAYSGEWGLWAEDRTRVLGFCSILVPPSTVSLNPDPIDPADFQKLLAAAADDPTMRAVLLVAMNCCMYPSEVADLEWKDFDLEQGTLVMDRGKTKVARIAVLWTRTVEALKLLPRKTNKPFLTDATRMAHNANTIGKEFRHLRESAKLPDVTFEQVRDGAYTSAIEADGVQWQHAQCLAGHRCGMSDRYVKRKPRLVAAACEAVERAYFPASASRKPQAA